MKYIGAISISVYHTYQPKYCTGVHGIYQKKDNNNRLSNFFVLFISIRYWNRHGPGVSLQRAKEHAPTIDSRQHTSSLCPPLKNLGWPDGRVTCDAFPPFFSFLLVAARNINKCIVVHPSNPEACSPFWTPCQDCNCYNSLGDSDTLQASPQHASADCFIHWASGYPVCNCLGQSLCSQRTKS